MSRAVPFTVGYVSTFVHKYRLMEKDNKKARDDARKEFNDTVRVCPKNMNICTNIVHNSH